MVAVRRPSAAAPLAIALLLALPAAGAAHWGPEPEPLRLTDVERPTFRGDTVPPPTPRANCRPGSNPETDIQGRVPSGSTAGFSCNLDLIGFEGRSGGFKVQRFVDRTGRECAYYDTTLLFPSNVQHLSSQPTGTAVLDMSDPSKPVRTATLPTPAMQSPHESLVLSEKRGLLVAVMGTASFYPGVVDVYDLNADCRDPELLASAPSGRLGHESGMAPDGRTFYATSLFTGDVTAVDISNPRLPTPIWVGRYPSHGLSVGPDGNRAYLADLGTGLTILDVSEIQARKPVPQERVVSRLTWDTLTIPQNAIPVEIGGRRYVVEIDEFSTPSRENPTPTSNGDRVGAARIIDIEDEAQPRVVSDLRLAVNQPESRDRVADDPGASSPAQGYAGHYCSVPRYKDPGIVACSFIASGLRVFDIRDPENPRELAYFVAPERPSSTGGEPSNYAMSAPAFVPERGEIWYSDGNSGFYAIRMFEGVSAFQPAAPAAGRRCLARRSPVGPRNIGRVRLGQTRGRALTRTRLQPSRRGRYSLAWCVTRSSGRVAAVFSSRSVLAKARLVVSSAPRHVALGARPGARLGRALRRLPRARRIAPGVYRAAPRSRRIIGVRAGKVRFVGVADRSLLARPRALRRYLSRAGL